MVIFIKNASKLISNLTISIRVQTSKRYYPGSGKKIGHISSFKRFSKTSSLSITNHRFMSKKHNSHFRRLREKIGVSKNNYHFERSRDVRIHNYRRIHRPYEYNNIRPKLHSKDPINAVTDSVTNYDKNKNTFTLEQKSIQNIAQNITEPLSISPLKVISKNVKTVYNSLFSNKNIKPSLLDQEHNLEQSGSCLISPDINLQVTSSNTAQLPVPSHTFEISQQAINLTLSSLSDNTLSSTQNQDSFYQEKLTYFEDKITSAADNITELKKVSKEIVSYCQNILNNNVQVCIEDNFQNNNVLFLIETNYSSEPWTSKIQEHLSQPMQKNRVTIKDMENQLLVLNRGFDILNKYGSQLPESILLEFMRYHNILKNNDAQYTQNNIGASADKKSIVQRCGEGFTLDDRVYKYMFAHPDAYFKMYRETPLTKNESLQIENKLKNGDFFVKTANLDPNVIRDHYSGILMGSGDIIHNIIGVTIIDETGKIFDIGINSFTSSQDDGTTYMGCKQIVNDDPKLQNKEQYCRPFRQAIYIPENNYITKNERFTEFATSTNYKGLGINLREKFYQEFINKKASLENMSIRMIQEITQPLLYKITNNLIKEDIIQQQKEYNKLQNKLKNVLYEEQTIRLQRLENISKNLLKEKNDKIFIKTLPKAFQDIIKIKNKLEVEIKLQTKTSSNNKNNK